MNPRENGWSVVISSAMRDFGMRHFFPDEYFASRGWGLEWVISDPKDLQKQPKVNTISGIHYRPAHYEGFQDQIPIVLNHLDNLPPSAYLSFHADLLATVGDEQAVRDYLFSLNALGQAHNKKILIENVGPRIDRHTPSWTYRVLDFIDQFGSVLEACPNIGLCLDIAHTMEADNCLNDLINKVYDKSLQGSSEETLPQEEFELWSKFLLALNKTSVVHWSLAHEDDMSQRTTHRWAKRFCQNKFMTTVKNSALESLLNPTKIHNLYSQVDNFLSAHFPANKQPDVALMWLIVLQNLGFKGTFVIESPAIATLLRDHQKPFEKEVEMLHNFR